MLGPSQPYAKVANRRRCCAPPGLIRQSGHDAQLPCHRTIRDPLKLRRRCARQFAAGRQAKALLHPADRRRHQVHVFHLQYSAA